MSVSVLLRVGGVNLVMVLRRQADHADTGAQLGVCVRETTAFAGPQTYAQSNFRG